MSSSVYSQNGSPVQIVYEGQKGLFITPKQARFINIAHVTWQECREQRDTLLEALDLCQDAFAIHDSLMDVKNRQLSILQASIQDRSNLITVQTTSIKEKDKAIRKLRTSKTILGVSTGVFGIATLILLILL